MKRGALLSSCCVAALLFQPRLSLASETTRYAYDALGRLVVTSIGGGPNNGIGTTR